MDILQQIRNFIAKLSSKRFLLPMALAIKHSELCDKLESKILEMEKNLHQVLEENEKLNEKLIKNYKTSQDDFASDIKIFLRDENFSDFTIKICDRTFKVHKFVLAARSSIFAEMIKNNKEATNLELLDIPVDIFNVILDFIYFDKIPLENVDFKNIFIASGRLNLKVLKEFSGKKLLNLVNDENVLEILTIANKYHQEELKKKCFEKIQSMFPDHKIKPDLINDPEKMREFFNEKRALSVMMEKFKEKFEVCEGKN